MKIRAINLLYKGSRDGFTADAFHEKCNNKGPTLMFVRTDDVAFGAFTKAEWDLSERFKQDPDAFLFSLTDQKLFNIKHELSQNAIFCSANQGPAFGFASDLQIFGQT